MSELTNLQICKRIAEIEFDDLIDCYEHEFDGICIDKPMCGMVFREAYNPLTDDALCFQLMVKHKISLIQHQDNTAVYCIWNHDEKHATSVITSPNKAICLAIIEAHKVQS